MASPIAFNCFALDLGKKIHHLDTDVLKVYLSNVAPALTDTVYNTPADLATAGGYTAGGISIGSNTWAQISGVASLVPGLSPVWTATSGFGPFRYALLYNFTAAAKNLICYWDNGAPVSIAAGKDFDFNFGSSVLSFHF